MKSSTTLFQNTFPDSAVKLVKHSTQPKLSQITDCTEASACDVYLSQNILATIVIPEAYERYRGLVVSRKIPQTLHQPKLRYD